MAFRAIDKTMNNFGNTFARQVTNPFSRHDLLSGGVAPPPDPFARAGDVRYFTATETKAGELNPDGSKKFPGGPDDARLAEEQAKAVAEEQKIANELRKAAKDMARSESDLARLAHLPEEKFVEFRTEVLDYARELSAVQNRHIEELITAHAAGPPDEDNWSAADELQNAEREHDLLGKFVTELKSLGKTPKDILRAQEIRDRLEGIAGKVKDRELTQLDVQPPAPPALLEDIYEATQEFRPERQRIVRLREKEEESPFARRRESPAARSTKRAKHRGSFVDDEDTDFADAF